MELTHTAVRSGRLSSFLRGEMKLSLGLMNKLKWGSSLRVNGEPRWTNYEVQPGDLIAVTLEEEKPEYPAEQGELTILYEDEFLLAVEKPAGMLIHPSRAKNSGTLANLVVGYYERTGQSSAFHPMTRLDRDTFGVVLLAKNAYAHALLQQTEIGKTYHALVHRGPEGEAGVWEWPIDRRPLPSLLRYVSPTGKPSRTEYRVLERGENWARLALRPVTGRTHQLRVHCSHAGCPILGDPQYGNEESLALSASWGLSSQLLCAKELKLRHPVTGDSLILTSGFETERGERYGKKTV